MKHTKLNFYRSSANDLTYKIFRFKNENKDLTTDYFINTEADLIVVENTHNADIVNLKDYNSTIINEIESYGDFYAVSLPFDIIHNNSILTVNFKNNPFSIINSRLRITFGTNVISKLEYMAKETVIKVVTDPIIIETLVKIYTSNTILLNIAEFYAENCTIDITAHKLPIIDTEAHGIFSPNISTLKSKDYLLIYQDIKFHKNIYYYKSIAFNETSITEVSETKVVEITEDTEKIKTLIECSNDYYSSEIPTWNEFREEIEYNPTSEIKIYNNEFASEIIKNIYDHEINADDRLLFSDGIRVIKIPNIWHKDRRYIMLRPKKAFRIKNISIENETVESIYSEPIAINGDIEILIDKMVVLKRNVTGLPNDVASLPLTFNDIKAKVLKIYIRQGGIYYKDHIIGEYETNNFITYKDLTSSVTLDSRFPIISIKDECLHSNRYNYTVYLFDETGKISDPVTTVI